MARNWNIAGTPSSRINRKCFPRASLGVRRKPCCYISSPAERSPRSPEAALVERYEKRIAWPVKLTELPETGGKVAEPVTPARLVLLDERGRDLSSKELANMLGDWRDNGIREARFVVGAADGHTDEERAGADLLLTFGSSTWPHLLARAMLMEQLYRATAILAGHPYHRAG